MHPQLPTHPHGQQCTCHAWSCLQGRIATFMHGDEPLGPPRVWLKDVNVPGLWCVRLPPLLIACVIAARQQRMRGPAGRQPRTGICAADWLQGMHPGKGFSASQLCGCCRQLLLQHDAVLWRQCGRHGGRHRPPRGHAGAHQGRSGQVGPKATAAGLLLVCPVPVQACAARSSSPLSPHPHHPSLFNTCALRLLQVPGGDVGRHL